MNQKINDMRPSIDRRYENDFQEETNMNELSSNTVRRQLDELAALRSNGFPFTSLYLNTQADQHGRDNFAPFVRKELSRRVKSFAPGSEERASFEHDVERIWNYLDNDLRASANGLAIFVSSGAGGYFKAIQFDAPIQKNEVHVSDSPHLYPLAHLIDSYPRYIALVTDTDMARLFVFELGRTKRTKELDNTGHSLAPDGVRTQLRYRRRLEKYNLLHAKEVAGMLERVVREEGADHVILGGDDLIIPLLREQLPVQVSDKIIEVLRMDIRTPEHEILKATMAALRDDNIQTDAEKVIELLDKNSSGGLAVMGIGRTLNALELGQVDEVLISVPIEEIRFSDEFDEGLASELKNADAPTDAGENNGEGKLTPEILADRLISLARSTNAAITFIEDAALLSDVGGVGAFLRYRAW